MVSEHWLKERKFQICVRYTGMNACQWQVYYYFCLVGLDVNQWGHLLYLCLSDVYSFYVFLKYKKRTGFEQLQLFKCYIIV